MTSVLIFAPTSTSLEKMREQGRTHFAVLPADKESLLYGGEPKGGVHGKRAVVEPKVLLSAQQRAERICASFQCAHEAHLSLSAA